MDHGATCDSECWTDALARDGFTLIPDAVSPSEVERLRAVCASLRQQDFAAVRRDSLFGIRRLLTNSPELRATMAKPPFVSWARSVLGPAAVPVYGVFFDKTAGANWPVRWHQDVAIHAGGTLPVAGYEARPGKDGVAHLLPPVEVSQQMLAIRIHLDDAPSNHGALRVIPGSHLLGRLSNDALRHLIDGAQAVHCEARAGDVMLMRPLLVHASSPCELPSHRRVVHIEYSAFQLPDGLEWCG
ncbi:phytanoyl-CoA dioxygenase family protein [Schlesneria paludicola]|uniref:phytanoyl-CoA dioxygenase family protein n=1 Tax=Schlesneria paludicola TaxID=360056 RepID=UPI00029B06A7|nr:phytanoyl-CoA dioxygenase family protein [Schlesneria paludicola]